MTTCGTTTSVPVAPGVARRRLPARRVAVLLVATAALMTACGGGGFRSSAPYAGDIEPTLARPAPQLVERPATETGSPPRPAESLVVDTGPSAAPSPLPPAPQGTAEPAPSPDPVFSFGGTTAASPGPPQGGTSAAQRPAPRPAAPVPSAVSPGVPQLALAPPPPEPPAALSASPRQGQAPPTTQAAVASAPSAVDPQQFLAPRPAVPTAYPRLSSVPPTPPLPQARETARLQAQLAEDRAQLEAGRAPTSQRPVAAPTSIEQPAPAPAAPVITAQAPPEPMRPSPSVSTEPVGMTGQRTGLEAANLEPGGVEPPRGPFLVDRPAQLPTPSSPAATATAASAAAPAIEAPPRQPATPLPALPALATAPAVQPETSVARAPIPQRAAPSEPEFATTPTAAGRVAPPERQPTQQVAALPPAGGGPDPVRIAMQERFSQSGATGSSQLAALPSSAPRAVAPSGFQVAVLYFAGGESGLTEQNAAVLRQVAQAQRDRNAPLRIIGHALVPDGDVTSSPQRRNFEVSLRRANTVAEALARLGVPTGAIQVTALGDTQPTDRPATSRRVQILMDL